MRETPLWSRGDLSNFEAFITLVLGRNRRTLNAELPTAGDSQKLRTPFLLSGTAGTVQGSSNRRSMPMRETPLWSIPQFFDTI
jgi:hypothetical protein